MAAISDFRLEADARAREWLELHAAAALTEGFALTSTGFGGENAVDRVAGIETDRHQRCYRNHRRQTRWNHLGVL